MMTPSRNLIHLGPSTLLPMVFVSCFLVSFALADFPAGHGPRLPSAATGLSVGPQPLTAGIDHNGRFYLLESARWKPVADAELPARVRSLIGSRRGATRLYVTADRNVTYGRLLVLAEAARGAGVQQLDLATSCPRGTESLLTACGR
jgi:biopolymer transport protein ExbD